MSCFLIPLLKHRTTSELFPKPNETDESSKLRYTLSGMCVRAIKSTGKIIDLMQRSIFALDKAGSGIFTHLPDRATFPQNMRTKKVWKSAKTEGEETIKMLDSSGQVETFDREYIFVAKESPIGPWLMLEPIKGNLPILKDSLIGFNLRPGTTLTQAQELARTMNDHVQKVTQTQFAELFNDMG